MKLRNQNELFGDRKADRTAEPSFVLLPSSVLILTCCNFNRSILVVCLKNGPEPDQS